MTTTEIAVRENGYVPELARDVVDGWLPLASDIIKLANVIAETEFVPEEYRDSPPAVAAAILVGRELGIGPMMSLRHVQLVKGVPTLSAEYKRARVLAAGHDFEIEELTTTRCRVRGRRTGTARWLDCTFTIDDARKAHLIKDKGAWVTRPRRMLFARAGSELCDFLFADVVNGLPTAELVADGASGDEFAGYDEAPSQAPAGPQTARRRQAAVPKSEGTGPAVPDEKAPGGPAAGPDPSLPPLPGEEAAEQDDPDLPVMNTLADFTVELARHADHKLSKHGRCIYCDTCGQRLYQGLMLGAEDRAELRKLLDEHGTATRGKGGQLTALWTVLSTVFEFSSDQKDQARSVAEHVIGRDLPGTTGDLSYNEARTVLDTLANWQKVAESRGEHPRDVMIAAMAEGGADG